MRRTLDVGKMRFYQIAQDMADQDMRLLDASGILSGNDQADVRDVTQLAAIASTESNGCNSAGFRRLDGAQHIRAGARGADAEKKIARLPNGFELTGEYALKAAVVSDRG
jgi:hypothetical protein